MRRFLAFAIAGLALVPPANAEPVRTAIFFYPWFSTPAHDGGYAHWQQGDHSPPFDIGSVFFPARGVYSSGDPRVVRAQMHDIKRAGVDEVVSSWWGWGSPEDRRLLTVRRAAAKEGLTVAVQLEPYAGRTVATIGQDLVHLRDVGIRDVYVYRANDFTAEDWATLDLSLSGLRVFAQTSRVGFAARAGFAGFYTYDIVVYGGDKFERLCGEARSVGLLCAPSVGPGYDASMATGDPVVKERDGGLTYDTMWRAAIAAHADLVTITSYNEWSEGTQIEPAAERPPYETYDGAYGLRGRAAPNAYLMATRRWTMRFRALQSR